VPFDDLLRGHRANNIIAGGEMFLPPIDVPGPSGNDTIYGSAGDDFLLGGDGTDSLFGGKGADACKGGEEITDCE